MIDFVEDRFEEHVGAGVVLDFPNQFSTPGTMQLLHGRMW